MPNKDLLVQRLELWKQNLDLYKLQEAQQGGRIDATLNNNIRLAQDRIREIERQLDSGEEIDTEQIDSEIIPMLVGINRQVQQNRHDINRMLARIYPSAKTMILLVVAMLSIVAASPFGHWSIKEWRGIYLSSGSMMTLGLGISALFLIVALLLLYLVKEDMS